MSDKKSSRTLKDLGERAIVDQVLRKYCDAGIGSDCALLDVDAGRVVVTTDPVPEPAAFVIGGDADLYWRGWLLATINASDLAAAGASPLGFVAALEAPADLLVDDFERLVAGISESCRAEGLRYVGGNLKEGQKLIGVGTAIGWVDVDGGLQRTGIRSGDVVGIVGSGGEFWSDALFLANGGRISDVHSSPVFKPRSQLRAMHALSSGMKLHAAIDNSDGLLPTFQQLCSANGLALLVDLERLPPPGNYLERKQVINISHQRLWLGWGDWNVVVAFSPEDEPTFHQIAASEGFVATTCGVFGEGTPSVTLNYRGERMSAPRVESERFSADSWFVAGIDRYIEILRTATLPDGL